MTDDQISIINVTRK